MREFTWFAVAGVFMLGFGTAWEAGAQTPAEQPSLALYCRGPLNTIRTEGGRVIRTPFRWAKDAAAKERPGAGECAWADRPPEAPDSPGGAAVIVGNLGPFDSLPVETIGKVCVTRASGQPNELVVRQVVRQLGHQTSPFHLPPFTAEGC